MQIYSAINLGKLCLPNTPLKLVVRSLFDNILITSLTPTGRQSIRSFCRWKERNHRAINQRVGGPAPIVIVPKKDGTFRLCVDYQKLNSISKADTYHMPQIDELIDCLGGVKYITTLDQTWGYWQVPVAEAFREQTAFTTPFGLY